MLFANAVKLKQIFGASFNEESIFVILKMRQLEGETFERMYAQCCESIRHVSSNDDTISRESLEFHNRSRKSTLTESMIQEPQIMEMVTYAKHHQ